MYDEDMMELEFIADEDEADTLNFYLTNRNRLALLLEDINQAARVADAYARLEVALHV